MTFISFPRLIAVDRIDNNMCNKSGDTGASVLSFFILEKDSSPYCHSYDVSWGLSFIGFTMLRHLPSITILRDFTINGDSVYPVFSIFSERITLYILFYLLYPQWGSEFRIFWHILNPPSAGMFYLHFNHENLCQNLGF